VRSFYFVPPTEERAPDNLIAATETKPAPAPVQVAAAEPATQAEPIARQAEAPETETVAETAVPQSAAPVFLAQTRSLFAKSGSRLRAEPSTDAAILAKLPANAEIRAVARSKDGDWWKVATRQGATAYVHSDAVTDFRAAKPKPATTQAAATHPVSAIAPRPAPAATGIGVVDQALGWLSSVSAKGRPASQPIRATR